VASSAGLASQSTSGKISRSTSPKVKRSRQALSGVRQFELPRRITVEDLIAPILRSGMETRANSWMDIVPSL
jgi:hypothetical protein